MADLETAINSINTEAVTLLTPLVTDKTIKEIVVGDKVKGSINIPYIKLGIGDLNIDYTTLGSSSQLEAWNYELKVGVAVKELDTPSRGISKAVGILSKARKKLLENRQFNLPNIVRKVDSKQIQIIPVPFGKKKTLYGAGMKLNFLIILKE